MELDKRITNGRKPFDCVDAGISETVKSFIGKKGYFANHISEFTDISDLEEDVLTFINPDEPDCEVYTASCETWEYFLPSEWVKEPEKKYRPYKNAQELFDDIGVYIGDSIHFRSKLKQTEYHALITLYSTPKDEVETLSFGGFMHRYTMQELFDLFELRSRGGWIPFGVEVRDGE